MKENHLSELWGDIVPDQVPCPHMDPEHIVRRVNATLDGLPSERSRHMRQKTRFAAVLIAAAVALVGTALAVTVHLDVLDTFFRGDTSSAEALVDREVRSVRDENYTLTVESSVSDRSTAYLVVRVDALNGDSAERLRSDTFFDGETFDISPASGPETPSDEERGDNPIDIGIIHLLSLEEIEAFATDTSRTWRVFFTLKSDEITHLQVHLRQMDEGDVLMVPLAPADSITVDLHHTGPSTSVGLPDAQSNRVTVDSVTLSPFTCRVSVQAAEDDELVEPYLSFLFMDGTLSSLAQSIDSLSAYTYWEDGTGFYLYRLQSVMDLSQLAAVVFDGVAYPLDGGAPYPYTL